MLCKIMISILYYFPVSRPHPFVADLYGILHDCNYCFCMCGIPDKVWPASVLCFLWSHQTGYLIKTGQWHVFCVICASGVLQLRRLQCLQDTEGIVPLTSFSLSQAIKVHKCEFFECYWPVNDLMAYLSYWYLPKVNRLCCLLIELVAFVNTDYTKLS